MKREKIKQIKRKPITLMRKSRKLIHIVHPVEAAKKTLNKMCIANWVKKSKSQSKWPDEWDEYHVKYTIELRMHPKFDGKEEQVGSGEGKKVKKKRIHETKNKQQQQFNI